MIKIIIFILFIEIWYTAGQIFFKKATDRLAPPKLTNVRTHLAFISCVLQIPAVWLGFLSLGIGVVLWLVALAQNDLSLVYPLGSTQYVLTLLAARIFLGEKMDRPKLAGTFLVVAGIVLIATS